MSQVFQYSPVIVELGSFVTTAIMYILLYYRWGYVSKWSNIRMIESVMASPFY